MHTPISIQRATPAQAHDIAVMVGELLQEIMQRVGQQAFQFTLSETSARLTEYLRQDKYFVFVARENDGKPAGFIAVVETHALYAEGTFGIIPELYLRPDYRAGGIGHRLMDTAVEFATARGWKRLEVTTPPLPQFDPTLTFYEREGFSITGGRKMKRLL